MITLVRIPIPSTYDVHAPVVMVDGPNANRFGVPYVEGTSVVVPVDSFGGGKCQYGLVMAGQVRPESGVLLQYPVKIDKQPTRYICGTCIP